MVQILPEPKHLCRLDLRVGLTKALAWRPSACCPLGTMKQKLWLPLVTYLAYCVDKGLWKAIDYLKEQVRILQEQQEIHSIRRSS